MSRDINYGNLMHTAMRGLIKTVLAQVSEEGLPGSHHFFITFDTRHEGVELADWLRQRYPCDMTIVMQHWFENLIVDEDGFSITLNFGDTPEPLYIPYSAIKTFVDPSVEFGLRFESSNEDEDEELSEASDALEAEDQDTDEEQHDADVVSLDSFRK